MDYSLELNRKLEKIKKVVDITYLIDEKEDQEKIVDYYRKNLLPYKIFHNRSGFLHMGITKKGEKYSNNDLKYQIEDVAKCIEKNNAKSVLELGSGIGSNSYTLAKRFTEVKFSTIDLSNKPPRKYLELENFAFTQGDYHDLSQFKDDTFDTVFVFEALCHSNNKSQVLDEVSRVLKANGFFIIYDGYAGKKDLTEAEKVASVLVEKGMAVDKFELLDSFEEKIKKSNFKIREKNDFSEEVIPTMKRFEFLARGFYKFSFLGKIIKQFIPEIFLRNSYAGYLMPLLIKLKVAVYYRHILINKK